jgi:hypothetical protein
MPTILFSIFLLISGRVAIRPKAFLNLRFKLSV